MFITSRDVLEHQATEAEQATVLLYQATSDYEDAAGDSTLRASRSCNVKDCQRHANSYGW